MMPTPDDWTRHEADEALVSTTVSSPSDPVDRCWDERLVKPASREDFLAAVARLFKAR